MLFCVLLQYKLPILSISLKLEGLNTYSMSVLADVRRGIRARAESDKILSVTWPVAILLLLIFGTFFTTGGVAVGEPILLVVGAAIIVVAVILWCILAYRLIERRNEHFKRQMFLFEDLTNCVSNLASRKGIDVSENVAVCERITREAKYKETEKGAALWVFLAYATGLAWFYIAYFLMRDFYRHERREDEFWDAASEALTRLGVEPLPKRHNAIPERGFWLYLILGIVTAGIFWVYWWYTLIKDPNEHFEHHALVEEGLLSKLEVLAAR